MKLFDANVMIFQVVFQVLSHFFQNNKNKSTIGWLVNFLWRNGFRKTVWNVRETYKFLQEMDS